MAVNIAKLAILLTTDTSGMQRGFAQGGAALSQFSQKLSQVGFAAYTATLTAAVTATGLFMREGIRMNAVMEQIGISLKVMTGSAKEGTKLLDDMWKLAAQTPFSFEDVATAGKVLLAMGVSARDIIPTLEMLGDVSAGTGQPVRELAQVFGEVQNAGRLTSNELRQFNMRGIPLLAELSDMLGKTKGQIRGMVEEGAISADQVTAAFDRMRSAGGKFDNLMAEQSKTLVGQWSTFKDNMSQLAQEMTGGSSGWLKDLLQGMNKGFSERSMVGNQLVKELSRSWWFNPQKKGFFNLPELVGIPENKRVQAAQIARDERIAKARTDALEAEGRKHDKILQQMFEEEQQAYDDHQKALKKEAEKISRALFTPDEVMADHIADAKEMLREGFLDAEMYQRQIKNISDEYRKATGEANKLKGVFRGNMNPAVEFHSSAGASAIGAAKAEMARMVMEQKESNDHLKKIEAALAGVATF